MNSDKLPDVLKPGLKVVFVGTAAGKRSAALKAYYAGPGNRFWRTLFEVGLTPRELAPHEFEEVKLFGLGFTDLAKSVVSKDDRLRDRDFQRERLLQAIARFRPKFLAFNGKRAASVAMQKPSSSMKYGRQRDSIGGAHVFVLPSTSGAARGFWNIRHWRDLAAAIAG